MSLAITKSRSNTTSFLRNYGENSEAYRDLKFSFVDMGGVKMDYVGLLNHVLRAADPQGRSELAREGVKSVAYRTSLLRTSRTFCGGTGA